MESRLEFQQAPNQLELLKLALEAMIDPIVKRLDLMIEQRQKSKEARNTNNTLVAAKDEHLDDDAKIKTMVSSDLNLVSSAVPAKHHELVCHESSPEPNRGASELEKKEIDPRMHPFQHQHAKLKLRCEHAKNEPQQACRRLGEKVRLGGEPPPKFMVGDQTGRERFRPGYTRLGSVSCFQQMRPMMDIIIRGGEKNIKDSSRVMSIFPALHHNEARQETSSEHSRCAPEPEREEHERAWWQRRRSPAGKQGEPTDLYECDTIRDGGVVVSIDGYGLIIFLIRLGPVHVLGPKVITKGPMAKLSHILEKSWDPGITSSPSNHTMTERRAAGTVRTDGGQRFGYIEDVTSPNNSWVFDRERRTTFRKCALFKSNFFSHLEDKLLVYGTNKVLPCSLKVLQSNLIYFLVVSWSSQVEFGRVSWARDKRVSIEIAAYRFGRTPPHMIYSHDGKRNVSMCTPENLLQCDGKVKIVSAITGIFDRGKIITLPKEQGNLNHSRLQFIGKEWLKILLESPDDQYSRIGSPSNLVLTKCAPDFVIPTPKRPLAFISWMVVDNSGVPLLVIAGFLDNGRNITKSKDETYQLGLPGISYGIGPPTNNFLSSIWLISDSGHYPLMTMVILIIQIMQLISITSAITTVMGLKGFDGKYNQFGFKNFSVESGIMIAYVHSRFIVLNWRVNEAVDSLFQQWGKLNLEYEDYLARGRETFTIVKNEFTMNPKELLAFLVREKSRTQLDEFYLGGSYNNPLTPTSTIFNIQGHDKKVLHKLHLLDWFFDRGRRDNWFGNTRSGGGSELLKLGIFPHSVNNTHCWLGALTEDEQGWQLKLHVLHLEDKVNFGRPVLLGLKINKKGISVIVMG